MIKFGHRATFYAKLIAFLALSGHILDHQSKIVFIFRFTDEEVIIGALAIHRIVNPSIFTTEHFKFVVAHRPVVKLVEPLIEAIIGLELILIGAIAGIPSGVPVIFLACKFKLEVFLGRVLAPVFHCSDALAQVEVSVCQGTAPFTFLVSVIEQVRLVLRPRDHVSCSVTELEQPAILAQIRSLISVQFSVKYPTVIIKAIIVMVCFLYVILLAWEVVLLGAIGLGWAKDLLLCLSYTSQGESCSNLECLHFVFFCVKCF